MPSRRVVEFSRALLLGAAVLCGACATARSDFERASKANTAAAFREFLREHPNSEFRPQAEKAIARLEARRARSRGERARKRGEDEKRRWQEAETADTLQAYEAFLIQPRFRSSKYRPLAVAAYKKIVRQRALARERPVERVSALPSPGFSAQDLRKAFPTSRSSYIEEVEDAGVLGPAGGAKVVVGNRFTTLSMSGLTSSLTSSASPRLVAELYADPDGSLFVEINGTGRGSTSEEAAETVGSEVSIAFKGSGVIVLRGDGPTRVLELGGGSILEGAP